LQLVVQKKKKKKKKGNMMDQTTAAIGGLAVGAYLIALFGVFCYKTGVLASFGRKPLDKKRLLAVSAGAFVPGIGCLCSIYLGSIDWMLRFPPVLAFGMATVAVACRKSLMVIEGIAMQGWAEMKEREQLASSDVKTKQ
jgi:hypothetical protein